MQLARALLRGRLVLLIRKSERSHKLVFLSQETARSHTLVLLRREIKRSQQLVFLSRETEGSHKLVLLSWASHRPHKLVLLSRESERSHKVREQLAGQRCLLSLVMASQGLYVRLQGEWEVIGVCETLNLSPYAAFSQQRSAAFHPFRCQ